MTLDDYADWAAGVAGLPRGEAVSLEKLAYLGLGIAGEAGEVADAIKKRLRDGKGDPAVIADELGDVVYYWACLCRAHGLAPGEVLARSRAKITARLEAVEPGRVGDQDAFD